MVGPHGDVYRGAGCVGYSIGIGNGSDGATGMIGTIGGDGIGAEIGGGGGAGAAMGVGARSA